MNILIVEDSPEKLDILSGLFKDAGFSVSTATDGYEAITIINTIKIEIIVSDLNLTHMDGYTLAREIRSKDKDTPFLIYTSKSSSVKDMIKLAASQGVEFIESSNLEEILRQTLTRFDKAIKENKLRHESL